LSSFPSSSSSSSVYIGITTTKANKLNHNKHGSKMIFKTKTQQQ